MSNNSVNNIDATIDYYEEPVDSPRTTPVLDIPTAPHSPKEYERSLQIHILSKFARTRLYSALKVGQKIYE